MPADLHSRLTVSRAVLFRAVKCEFSAGQAVSASVFNMAAPVLVWHPETIGYVEPVSCAARNAWVHRSPDIAAQTLLLLAALPEAVYSPG